MPEPFPVEVAFVYGFHQWAGIVFAVMAILCSPQNEARATTPSAIYKIGTAAALGDFSLTLNHVELVPGSEKSARGAIVEIRYTIQNIAPGSVPLTRFPVLHLEDHAGGVYEAQAAGRGNADRILAPGEQVSGVARFHIPENAADTLGWLLRAGDARGPRITLR